MHLPDRKAKTNRVQLFTIVESALAACAPMDSANLNFEERILVVDDDDSIRGLIMSMLSRSGFDCRSASSGEGALATLQSDTKYSLVLSDLAMDGMDGLALLERVRKLDPQLPVVMVT